MRRFIFNVLPVALLAIGGQSLAIEVGDIANGWTNSGPELYEMNGRNGFIGRGNIGFACYTKKNQHKQRAVACFAENGDGSFWYAETTDLNVNEHSMGWSDHARQGCKFVNQKITELKLSRKPKYEGRPGWLNAGKTVGPGCKVPKNYLNAGEKLNSGEKIFSSNGAYMLYMHEDDGNLCVYKANNGEQGDFVWGAYNTTGESYALEAGNYLTMQLDGNLCVTNKAKAFRWGVLSG